MGLAQTRSGGAVFSTRQLAESAAAEWGLVNPRIEQHSLHGELVGDSVFVAHVYEQDSDEFDLLGVYSDYLAGRAAAGERCEVLEQKVDPDPSNRGIAEQ